MTTTQNTDGTFTRTIPAYILGGVQAKVAKLNRKAVALGVPEMVLTAGPMRTVPKEPGSRVLVDLVDITYTVPEIKLAGYTFLGRLDQEGGAVIVCGVPGQIMPEAFRQPTTHCDHCGTSRKRKAYYAFQRGPGIAPIRVGSTCLKDFMGHSAEAATWYARVAGDLDDECDRLGSSGGELTFGRMDVLAQTVAVIRTLGWVSKSASEAYAARAAVDDNAHRAPNPTSYEVSRQLDPPRGRAALHFVAIAVTIADQEQARQALAWLQETIAPKAGKSDYEHNLVAICSMESIGFRRLGVACSLIAAYQREQERLVLQRAERASMVNAHVGQIGQRRTFEGTVVGMHAFETAFGTTHLVRINTAEGLVVVKGSTEWFSEAVVRGATVKVLATIKKHDEYKGMRQTIVNRAVEQ